MPLAPQVYGAIALLLSTESIPRGLDVSADGNTVFTAWNNSILVSDLGKGHIAQEKCIKTNYQSPSITFRLVFSAF